MAASSQPDYTPPSSTVMRERQNEPYALRLLIAQRYLYSRAKRWLALRWFGMLVIGLAAPVVSVIWPSLAVVVGAVAGLWLFLGQTLLMYAQSSNVTRAAAVQEQFDFYVYGMPSSIERSTTPTIEEICALAGPDDKLENIAVKEKLMDWYPINADDSGISAVAISQRANAVYTDRLLRATAIAWSIVTAVWVLILVGVSIGVGLSLATFLVGVLLPVLPAFLDIVRYVAGVWKAARGRRDLARSIEGRLRRVEDRIEGGDLLVWQDSLYDLRKTTPLVPDLLYKLRRAVNERSMKAAASQLGQQARRSGQ